MPAFNAAPWLADALDSLLAQSMTDFEVVVVDDASTDATWDVLQRYAAKDERIRVFRNERNVHVAATLNRAIELSRGGLLARMDADDVCHPDRLLRQMQFMADHPDVVVCGTAMQVCDEQMRQITTRHYYLDDATIRRHLFRFSPFCHASTVMRREAVRSVGGYDPSLWGAEDYDLFLRLGRKGAFANLSEVMYSMRVNPKGISMGSTARQEGLTLAIRRKAWREYGYERRAGDVAYWWAQKATSLVVPARVRYWAFTYVRGKLGAR